MANIITINGTRLDQVQMLLQSYGNGSVAYLSYPASQIHASRKRHTLCLVMPAYLAVELYRTGVLPQDEGAAVEVSAARGSSAWYLVSDVRYPNSNDGPFGKVTFTLTRVRTETVDAVDAADHAMHVRIPWPQEPEPT